MYTKGTVKASGCDVYKDGFADVYKYGFGISIELVELVHQRFKLGIYHERNIIHLLNTRSICIMSRDGFWSATYKTIPTSTTFLAPTSSCSACPRKHFFFYNYKRK